MPMLKYNIETGVATLPSQQSGDLTRLPNGLFCQLSQLINNYAIFIL